MSDRPGDDVPTDPWGNPLPPEQWPKTPPAAPPPASQPPERTDEQPGWAQPDATEPQPQYGQPQYGQPQYGQPQYGQPQYGQDPYNQGPYGQQWAQPGYGYVQPRIEGMAIGSLVCAVVGLLVCGVLLEPVAIVLGFVARNRIRQSNGTLKGEGLALAGIIVGIVGFVLSIVGLIIVMSNPDVFDFGAN